MALLITMLPFYLLGNFHCLGMCGPLAMMIGKHRYRYLYFLGRLFSFSLAGTIAGAIGAVSNVFLSSYHLSTFISFFFGCMIICAGLSLIFGWPDFGKGWIAKKTAKASQKISLLLLRDKPLATFIFGFMTVSLPCGQTIVVFSACALTESLSDGFINGFAFAVLTSPSLFFAMHAHFAFSLFKNHYNTIMGYGSIVIGTIAICRAFAEINLIPHVSFPIPYAHPLVLF